MAHKMTAFGDGSSSDSSDEDQEDFLHPSADPNADEFADYNPRKRRRTGRDQKESAALGIFGSESEDEGPGKRWKSKTIRTKGMTFVKPGQKPDGSDDDEDDNEDDDEAILQRTGLGAPKNVEEDEDEEMDDVEEDPKPRMGLGAASAQRGLGAGGLGWQSPAIKRAGLGTTTSSPLGRGFVPSSAGVPILQERDDDKPSPRVAMPSAFSTPTAAKHGKGPGKAQNGTSINAGSFAARMMAKMGYKEGQGLGKEGQGRSGVIEVQLRERGVGLGAVREKSKQERIEERRQAALKGEVLEDSEEEEKKKRQRKPKTSGTDSGMSTPKRRPKTKYQSLPEMQRAAPGLQIPDAFTPILDMTGPGHRLLTSTSGLLTPTGVPESTELVEAKKLARRAQSDLGAFVEEWKNLEERKAWVEMEIMQQQQAIDEQKSHSDEMNSVANIVQGLSDTVRDGQWDPVIKALVDVDGLGVTDNDELASIAVAAVHPFFRQAVEGWQPLDDPKLSGIASKGFAPALYSIRHLLGMTARGDGKSLALRDMGNNGHHHRAHKSTPYESMIYTAWLPKVRSAITNTWDVQNPAPLQTLLETWDGLLPEFIKSQILDQLVVRKLEEAVATWNPKKKRHSSLPHLWLFPWLQYLPAHHTDPKASTGLVSDVKRKFRQLIDSWDFRRGVIPGLQQWRSVLRPHDQSDQWTPLIMNHILPHLAKFLRVNFQVAPQDQEPFLPILNSTFEWHEILGPKIMGQLIVDEVFPMWHDVLHQWLTLDGVNYEEIGAWFEFWQGLFPRDINDVPAVKVEWERGMALINQALDLGLKAKNDLPAPSKADKTRKNENANDVPKPAASTPAKAVHEVEEMSFRQQLEDWCMAHDLQFIPEKSTLEANGPVYRVTAAPIGKGGVLIYLRGDEIYAQIKRGTWLPLGKEMDAMLELANR